MINTVAKDAQTAYRALNAHTASAAVIAAEDMGLDQQRFKARMVKAGSELLAREISAHGYFTTHHIPADEIRRTAANKTIGDRVGASETSSAALSRLDRVVKNLDERSAEREGESPKN